MPPPPCARVTSLRWSTPLAVVDPAHRFIAFRQPPTFTRITHEPCAQRQALYPGRPYLSVAPVGRYRQVQGPRGNPPGNRGLGCRDRHRGGAPDQYRTEPGGAEPAGCNLAG